MHDTPRACAQADNLFALARSLPAWTSKDPLVNFVCRDGSNRLHLSVADTVPLLGDHVRDQQHRPLVITTRTLRDFLEIAFVCLYSRNSQLTSPTPRSPPTSASDRLRRHSSNNDLSTAARPPLPSSPHAVT